MGMPKINYRGGQLPRSPCSRPYVTDLNIYCRWPATPPSHPAKETTYALAVLLYTTPDLSPTVHCMGLSSIELVLDLQLLYILHTITIRQNSANTGSTRFPVKKKPSKSGNQAVFIHFDQAHKPLKGIIKGCMGAGGPGSQ